MRTLKETDDSNVLFVFFCDKKKIGVDYVTDLMRKLKTDGANRAILILRENITPFAKKVIHSAAPMFVIELFKESELLINVTRHIYVPKHVLLSDEEKEELLQQYRLKETQLSRIKKDDPIARYYGLEKSQVVKITRPSETAGRYVTYRIVV
ncbi:hypothetical protein MHBO_004243 [Bonamia ostreae]